MQSIKSAFDSLNHSFFTRNTSFFLFQNLNGASKPCLKLNWDVWLQIFCDLKSSSFLKVHLKYSLVLMAPKSSRPLRLASKCSRCSSQSLKHTIMKNKNYDLGRGLGVPKIPNIGIFKMPPKIVVIPVMGTPEHLELGLILQNWPFARPPKFQNPHYGVKI